MQRALQSATPMVGSESCSHDAAVAWYEHASQSPPVTP